MKNVVVATLVNNLQPANKSQAMGTRGTELHLFLILIFKAIRPTTLPEKSKKFLFETSNKNTP